MNRNVFGSPVTETTVSQLAGHNEPTSSDLAQVALDMFEVDDRLENARAYLNRLADANRTLISTKVLIYNATGGTMTLMMQHDWSGQSVHSSPPAEIHNGQWGAFCHQKSQGPGSEGAVVYRLKFVSRDCLISWHNWPPTYDNYCYAEIRNSGGFDDIDWISILINMQGVFYNFCTVENQSVEIAIKIDNEEISECIAFVKHRIMNRNVFGSPVTERTLMELPEWPYDARERINLAIVALDMITEEGKLASARAYLKRLEDEYGNILCTKLLIYNATGETMTFIRQHHDWYSHFVHSAPPAEIHNGQWGVFFHQPRYRDYGDCTGKVVYRINCTDAEFEMSWHTQVYNQSSWDAKINDNSPTEENHCFQAEIPINQGNTSECIAYIMRAYAGLSSDIEF